VESELSSTDRGQLGPPRSRPRILPQSESETEDPRTITAEDIARPRPDPDQGPFWDPTTSELEREAGEAPTNTLREVSRPLVETEVEQEARRRVETAMAPFTQPAAAVEVGSQAMQQFRVGQEQRTRIGSLAETAVDVEQLLDVEAETAQETRVDTELGVKTEMELLEELETEFETEFEFEFELEVPDGGERDRETTATDEAGGVGSASVVGRAFAPGWINQYAVALAGGGLAARQAPEEIEQIAAERGTLLGLPTAGQVDPDEELRAGLEAVEELFFVSGGDTDDGAALDATPGGATGGADDDLLALLDFSGEESPGDTETDTGSDVDEDPWGLL